MRTPGLAHRLYAVELPVAGEPVRRGHLELGGRNPQGEVIAVNNRFIERGGRPFFPVVGEFHFVRCTADDWDEEIRKIKAGGVNVVATYVFWNLHEREQGAFDWSGNLALHRFVALCAHHRIDVIVRLGPFCHGEVRNGGLPDWLYGRTFEVRSNDPGYLALVGRLYGEIAGQLRGLLYRDGGPVIGVQLENEFQHSAAPWEISYPGSPRELTVAERDVGVSHPGAGASEVANPHAAHGRDHLCTLKQIAQQHGLGVPLYTATGWGNAAIVPQGCLPVTAGYAYPFWAPAQPSRLYLFTDLRRHPDYAPVSYDPELYPSIPAELGPGIMPTYTRRPRVPPESIAPLIVRVLGSGSNGIGYYMYHGGSTPVFGHFFSEELGGLPKINYDFQAPIGEYGQLRPHYHELKLLHLFLESHAATLAPLPTVLPPTNAAIAPDDTSTLRYAVRSAADVGFVFLHNFQDHVVTTDLTDLRIELGGRGAPVAFPLEGTFTLVAGASAILPFELDLGGVTLRSATVQPLTVLRDLGTVHHVYFSMDGLPPELVFHGRHAVVAQNCEASTAGDLTVVRGPAGAAFAFSLGGQAFFVVTRALACTVWKIGDDRLWFADATVTARDGVVDLVVPGREAVEVHVYPASESTPWIDGGSVVPSRSQHVAMTAFTVTFVERRPAFALTAVNHRKLVLKASGGFDGLHDVLLRIPYVGDRGMAFINGRLVADHFYYGEPWEIGLRRFAPWAVDREMVLMFHPVRRDHAFLTDLEEWALPDFAPGDATHLSLGRIEFVPVYRAVLKVP